MKESLVLDENPYVTTTEIDIDEEELIAQQVFAISQLTPAMMVANLINAMALVLMLYVSDNLYPSYVAWAGIAGAIALYMLWLYFKRRDKTARERHTKRTQRRLILHSGLLGAVWAIPAILILPHSNDITQAFLVALAAGMISGGAIMLYPIPAAALMYTGTIATGYLIGLGLTGEFNSLAFAIVTVTFFFVIERSIKRHEQIFASEFRSRRELVSKNEVIATLLDQTRVVASQQQEESEAKLARAQKMEAIGRLTAGVAHDFNNILAIIMGNIELAQIDLKDDEKNELLTAAHTATKNGAELTARLLAFSRKADLVPVVAELNSVIRNMEPLFTRTLPAAIEVKLALGAEPHFVKIDKSQFENAMINLALNARDAMNNGGCLTIETEFHDQRVDAADHPSPELPVTKFVTVKVKDTGIGIPADQIDKVFEPFHTTKPAGEGSGLGLAMVYGFANQSGGVAEVSSEVGVGTTVTLYFPVAEDLQSRIGPKQPERVDSFKGSGRALLVEDYEAVRKVVSIQLTKIGYEVEEVGSGDEAHQLLKSGATFDLVVTDLSMPGQMQGSGLAKWISVEFPTTKVILMSGYPKDAREELRSLGAEIPCLSKPIQINELRQTLQSLFAPKSH